MSMTKLIFINLAFAYRSDLVSDHKYILKMICVSPQLIRKLNVMLLQMSYKINLIKI